MNHQFDFASGPPSADSASDLVIEVPRGIRDEAVLLDFYAAHLKFPDYFGKNWDALDECIRDLSWLQQTTLVVFHRDIPPLDSVKNQSIYLKILADTVDWWRARTELKFRAVFDPKLAARIKSLVTLNCHEADGIENEVGP